MTYVNLGWINLIVIGVLVSPYVLNFLNRKFFKTKNKTYKKVLKFARKVHKPLALLIVILAPIHGYMALGTLFRLHTGTLLYLSILITAIFGGLFYRLKKRKLFKLHKAMALVTVIVFLVHFYFPGAIFYLLN